MMPHARLCDRDKPAPPTASARGPAPNIVVRTSATWRQPALAPVQMRLHPRVGHLVEPTKPPDRCTFLPPPVGEEDAREAPTLAT